MKAIKGTKSPQKVISLLKDFLENEDVGSVQRAKATDKLARTLAQNGQVDVADAVVKKGISVAKNIDDQQHLMRLYQIDSVIACRLSDYKRGEKSATKSIELAESSDSRFYPFLPLIERAINRLNLNHFEPALSDFNEALQIAKQQDEDSWRMRVLCNLSPAYGMMKQYDREAETIQQALVLAQKFKNAHAIASLTVNLGTNLLARNELDEAMTLLKEARKMAQENNLKQVEAIADTGIGDVLVRLNQPDEALRHFELSYQIYKKMNDKVGVIQTESRLAAMTDVLHQSNDSSRIRDLTRLVEEAREVGNHQLVVSLLDQLIVAVKRSEDWEKTSELLLDRQAVERKIWAQESEQASLLIQNKKMELNRQRRAANTLIWICVGLTVLAALLAILWTLKRWAAKRLQHANVMMRKSEQQKRLLERELAQKEKVESLTVMSAGIIHDFNNFLSAIVSTAELGKLSEAASRKNELFESIVGTGMSASELTRNLSDYLGQGLSTETVCDLNEVIQAEKTFWKQIAAADVELVVNACSTPVWVNFDPVEIKQIVSNLVKNSSESFHGAAGQIEISILTHSKNSKSFCQLVVSDNGCGMTAEEVIRATDPFYSSKGVGRGLGLASVNGVAKRNDSQVYISSQVNVGTEVVVEIPVVDHEVLSGFPIRGDVTDDFKKGISFKRILLVEDDDNIRMSVTEFLSAHDVQVFATESAESAIAEMKSGTKYDCVVTDFLLPDQSGRYLAKNVKDISPGTPVILVSGYAETDVFETDLFDGFVRKPFRLVKLFSALRRIQTNKADKKPDNIARAK